MTDQQILDQFVTLAEFMSRCYTRDTEIVVHDISHLESSTIAIFNNHISGRDIGAPMTNKGCDFLKKNVYRTKNFVTNYKGITEKGIVVRSSTYFIKNGENKLIGVLCVNVDIRKHAQIRHLMDTFMAMDDGEEQAEFFQLSIGSAIGETIADYCSIHDRNIETLSMEDKVNLVSILSEKGIFDRKGAICEAAQQLGASEPTIYRYIKRIKKQD